MNQILQTENKRTRQADISNVVIFFAIALIIFGIILLGQGSYAVLFKNNQGTDSGVVSNPKPEVSINREESDVKIEIIHSVPILEVAYRWNDEEENYINTNNKTQISEKIELPIGRNTLYLRIVDENYETTEYEKEYVLEGNGRPTINLTVTNDNKIKIIAKDEQALKHIVYKWNNGQQTTIEANIDNLNQIEELVDIPLGQNTLKVTATNTQDVVTTKELEVKGINKPIVTVQRQGDSLIITAEDEGGMKVVNYTLNGKAFQLNFGDVKVIKYRQELFDGENLLILTAENKDGGITEYKGKCTK